MNQNQYHFNSGPTTSYSKVIKGEIHNVLSVIRTDPRYASPSRFSSQHQSQDQQQEHPIISSLRELNEHLTYEYLELHRSSRTLSNSLDSLTYLAPFCTAISSPDISAAITGACLSALHKFLLYGFIDPTTVKDAKEGITVVAQCIRHCSFQVSEGYNAASISSTNHHRKNTMTASQITDEEVVLKLLALASLVVRSSAGVQLLDSCDIVGIFDTCLHVATRVEDKASGLLKSAAADCLGSIVLVVFGTIPTVRREMVIQIQKDSGNESDIDAGEESSSGGDSDGNNSQGSDDLWCESDPSEPLLVDDRRITTGSTELLQTNAQVQTNVKNRLPSVGEETPALITIMSRLASLLNIQSNSERVCTQSLQLINIALETAPTDHLALYPELLNILKNTLCKHLLYLSTTSNLLILCQALRVIFNLFNSIKHHLKVQLEVFLTSVHLRILECSTNKAFSPEQREVALESLLEFCHEPSLMQDLYVNYDCDVQCTNLFETICRVLTDIAIGSDSSEGSKNMDDSMHPRSVHGSLQAPSILNNLACEGILAVIGSIARRCEVPVSVHRSGNDVENGAVLTTSSTPVKETNIFYKASPGSVDTDSIDTDSSTVDDLISPMSGGSSWMDDARHQTSRVLIERKQRKHKLAKISAKFDKKPLGKEWIATGQRLGIFSTPATARSVAHFLYSTPKLDKTSIGEYLSKGPKEKYPFHEEVLKNFVSLFDFAGFTFSEALRAFLLRFRLPGEAQCIDRLMEAFASRLYDQQRKCAKVPMNDMEGETMIPAQEDEDSPFSEENGMSIFQSADAIYVLAFSTIMLNTDLHNPTIKDDRRMSLDEFIRNNRGINDGKNFPVDFMTELYTQIKENEIQVQKDISDDINSNMHQWDGLMMAKSAEVAAPVFTSHDAARSTTSQAGIHERDMFLSIVSSALQSISSMFVRTNDRRLMLRLVKGIRQIASISIYFDLDHIYNESIAVLLEFGRDFIVDILGLAYGGYDGPDIAAAIDVPVKTDLPDIKMMTLELSPVEKEPLLKEPLLPYSPKAATNHDDNPVNETRGIEEKGLVALESALHLVTSHPKYLRDALPTLFECIFALRDAKALPHGLSELDDFASHDGFLLPSTPYASRSYYRAKMYMKSDYSTQENVKQSWLSGVFSKYNDSNSSRSLPRDEDFALEDYAGLLEGDGNADLSIPTSLLNELLSIAEQTMIGQFLIGKKDKNTATQMLCALLEETKPKPGEDMLFEHHAVFALELSARLLFCNMDHGIELFPLFVPRFKALLQFATDEEIPPNPFLIERVVVTILRSCIHMMDRADVRPSLLASLRLLLGIPESFLMHMVDRLACGMAIILHCSVSHITEPQDWDLLGGLIEVCAKSERGQTFIFDGITSCVDDRFPHTNAKELSVACTQRNGMIVTYDGASLFAQVLLKFTFGSYGNDLSFCAAALPCLERVYKYLYCISDSAPDEELWQATCSAFYSIALVEDVKAARNAIDALERFVLSNHIEKIADSSWIALMVLLVSKQPAITLEIPRIKAFNLLGKVLLFGLPILCSSERNWKAMTEIVLKAADHAALNLQCGDPLYENAVQALTNVINVMTMVPCKKGGDKFMESLITILSKELENVGAMEGVMQ